MSVSYPPASFVLQIGKISKETNWAGKGRRGYTRECDVMASVEYWAQIPTTTDRLAYPRIVRARKCQGILDARVEIVMHG